MLNDEERKEYIEHEILDRLYCLEENDFDKNKVDNGYIKAVLNACKEAKSLIEKQQKEIEELKKNNETQPDCVEPVEKTEEMVNMRWVNHRFISKDKIKEILGIEETNDEKILSLLQTLVDENARLEDIEDRKVQIEYNNVFNKGVKSVEDKIKAKIEESELLIDNSQGCMSNEDLYKEFGKIEFGKSLLEKE